MSLEKKIEEKLNESLKNKDKTVFPTLRLIISAIKDFKIAILKSFIADIISLKVGKTVLSLFLRLSFNFSSIFFSRDIFFIKFNHKLYLK